MKKFTLTLLRAAASMLLCLLVMAIPVMALAEEATAASFAFDWTPVLCAIITCVCTVAGTCFKHIWSKVVKPWLEERKLSDVAMVVVNAVEAILGRYCGEDKWQLALEKMQEKGYSVDANEVLDALKAAWNELNLSQIAAGVKPPDDVSEN